MSQINPFVPAIAGSPQAQRLAAADRDAQLRKTAQKHRSSGYVVEQQDEFVESADAIQPAEHREQQHPQQRRRPGKPPQDDDTPHLDIKA